MKTKWVNISSFIYISNIFFECNKEERLKLEEILIRFFHLLFSIFFALHNLQLCFLISTKHTQMKEKSSK